MTNHSIKHSDSLVFLLSLAGMVITFCGRLIGLWLVVVGITSKPFDPMWPVELLVGAPIAMVALIWAVFNYQQYGSSRLRNYAIVISLITIAWCALIFGAVMFADGGAV